jgi:hypothetical protein
MNEKPRESFESWDSLMKRTFLASLERAKEIEPNSRDWTTIWNSLLCYREYAERKYEDDQA